MTPRLVLLTGPAAGEVAQVFRDDCHCCCPEGDPHRRWDEVRDFLEVPRRLVDDPIGWGDTGPQETWDSEAGYVVERICEEPGGEAWLVGLVMPERDPGFYRESWGGTHQGLRRHMGLAARLAILAPEPPPLLVERVRAWGGEVWECGISAAPATAGKCLVTFGTKCFYADTWPEVVRAALGEVAP